MERAPRALLLIALQLNLGVSRNPGTFVDIAISEDNPHALREYASISIAYVAAEVLTIDPSGTPAAWSDMSPRAVPMPFRKDYDAEPGNDPLAWPTRLDLSRLILLGAHASGVRVGGAAVLTDTSVLDMTGPCQGVAVLWDLRVAPDFRRQHIGSTLLAAAEGLARARDARILQVETQNTNVPACRFYARHGYDLFAANRNAYPSLLAEVQLLCAKSLIEFVPRSG